MTRRPARLAALVAAALVPAAIVGVALAALGDGSDDPLQRIPAAVVNSDEFVTATGPDGEEQIILAGRALVTELTGPDAPGFDWRPTSAEEAARALAAGDVYAVVTIPADFSASIAALGEPDARAATIRIQTDDAHSYLAGSVTQAIGESLVAQFGAAITEQVLASVVGGLGDLGSALAEAGDGAFQLADGTRELGDGVAALGDGAAGIGSGARELGSGLTTLAGGTREAASGAGQSAAGARQLADGVAGYVGGVGQLANGLTLFASEVEPLPGLGAAIAGVDQQAAALAASLTALAPSVFGSNLSAADQQAFVDALTAAQILAGTTDAVSAQTGPALDGVVTGAAESAAGARALADGGAPLVVGLDGLTDGLGDLAGGLGQLADGIGQTAQGANALGNGADLLADGAAEAADGAAQLADGAAELGTGLTDGAADIPNADELDPAALLRPIDVQAERSHAVDGIGGLLVAALAPIALWLGAFAAAVAAPRQGAALVGSALGARAHVRRRVGALVISALVQGALVALLAPTLAGTTWASLPIVLLLTITAAVAFAALHLAVSLAFGRSVTVIASLVLLGVQAVVVGVVIPVDALVAPFPALAGLLPVPLLADGMLAALAGGDAGRVGTAVIVSVLLAVVASLVAVAAARQRRAAAVRSAYAVG
jgi:putative membrane protein